MVIARPIIALDFASKPETLAFLDHFPTDERLYVKIGMELFYSEGPNIVNEINARGHDIFLDLKFHDIPHTVYKAARAIGKLGVTMSTIHGAGGQEMLSAGLQGINEGAIAGHHKQPRLLAITQLTSTSQEQMQNEQLIKVPLVDSVLNYAGLAQKSGLDGVVCSAQEAGIIKENVVNPNRKFICVTPGIRLQKNDAGDQKRVMTPQNARKNGSSGIVVGRPITQAINPFLAYEEIKEDWETIS